MTTGPRLSPAGRRGGRGRRPGCPGRLGGSIGVAPLGTAFFGWAGPEGFRHAAGWTFGLCAGLLVLAFLVAFLLPRHARPHDEE
ncbi:hypothetical protein [Kitasatospora sp. NPDC091207]|uniref:hypothetical protein n=1 Tax=Kitasatospora sp. NPDC091207 TaxID=3364083 RepID=UPI0037F216D4